VALVAVYTIIPPDTAPCIHFLQRAQKEKNVPLKPGPQCNEASGGIYNSVIYSHSTVCNCL